MMVFFSFENYLLVLKIRILQKYYLIAEEVITNIFMEGWDLFYLGGDDEETDDEVKRM